MTSKDHMEVFNELLCVIQEVGKYEEYVLKQRRCGYCCS